MNVKPKLTLKYGLLLAGACTGVLTACTGVAPTGSDPSSLMMSSNDTASEYAASDQSLEFEDVTDSSIPEGEAIAEGGEGLIGEEEIILAETETEGDMELPVNPEFPDEEAIMAMGPEFGDTAEGEIVDVELSTELLDDQVIEEIPAIDGPEENEVAVDEMEVVPAKVPETSSEDDIIQPKLLGLAIESVGIEDNVLVADMESAGFYTFSKTAPSEYVLTLEGTAVSEGVIGSIAPRGSGKIRAARPVIEGENVLIRIFAEPTTDLKVKSRGNKIVVTAYNEEQIDLDEDAIRAQAEIGGDEGAGEDEFAEIFSIDEKYTGRLISLDLQDTEIDNALRIIAEVSNLNIIASEDVTGKVTLRLMDVPWDQALDVILKTNGLDKVQEGNVVRIAPVEKLRAEREALKQAIQAEEELEPLRVQYIRVSYAKAEQLQPLVETVLTERGTVAFDERSNQLIVKDIRKGLQNVARLVQKLDLRTPQVLIETQIVEAQTSFVRELGSELGFYYLRTPETGNALGYNFPNSVEIGGSAIDVTGGAQSVAPNVSFFPASNAASAVSALFDSADGSKGLRFRLSQGENEGKVRVVSRPSVAVTNNQPAVIKSVEKLRIKLPSGGVSVATGQGANAAGGSNVATEVIEIGIVLNVTAQASPDYYVLLDVEAKSSTLGPPQDTVDEIPPEIERSATSSVLVSSGQTFAMGGIYRITEDSVIRGVPFLKDIPVLGHLFRNTRVNDLDEELIFFITPRIVEGSFDDAAMKSATKRSS